MKRLLYLLCLGTGLAATACYRQAKRVERVKPVADASGWKAELQEKLPLLGHRNWIVITDMAYPLQTQSGITTLYADEPYAQVVAGVAEMIKSVPHTFAHIYQDKEQLALSEELCPGWTEYKEDLERAVDLKEVAYLPHEELIQKLDSVSKLYQVIIIKTGLTIPYTSTFFELDCKYWDAGREEAIRKKG